MAFSFATCERPRALEFMQRVYPDSGIEDTPESFGRLLDFVEKDIVRVLDPMMHGNKITIQGGKKWEDKYTQEVTDLFHELVGPLSK